MNSLRNHYVCSSRHHYCRLCDKSFKTASGFRVHLERSVLHRDDSDDDDDDDDDLVDDQPDGWEDEVARLEDEAERLRQVEDEIIVDEEEEKRVSPITRRIGILKLKTRKNIPPRRLRYNCPICLASLNNASATLCGHLFCTPCIEHALDTSGVCPTCRKPVFLSHLRKIDLHVY